MTAHGGRLGTSGLLKRSLVNAWPAPLLMVGRRKAARYTARQPLSGSREACLRGYDEPIEVCQQAPHARLSFWFESAGAILYYAPVIYRHLNLQEQAHGQKE